MNCLNNSLEATRVGAEVETGVGTEAKPGVELRDRAGPGEGEVLPGRRFR